MSPQAMSDRPLLQKCLDGLYCSIKENEELQKNRKSCPPCRDFLEETEWTKQPAAPLTAQKKTVCEIISRWKDNAIKYGKTEALKDCETILAFLNSL